MLWLGRACVLAGDMEEDNICVITSSEPEHPELNAESGTFVDYAINVF